MQLIRILYVYAVAINSCKYNAIVVYLSAIVYIRMQANNTLCTLYTRLLGI